MNISQQLAKHLRAVYTEENWTSMNLKDLLSDVTWKEANTKVQDLNTILALTYHVGYYVAGVLEVFKEKPLTIRDKYSYNHPEITSENDWQDMQKTIFKNVIELANHIEALPDNKIWENFADPKYGNYFRNINGIIEHTYYHLGQVSLLKKLIRTKNT
nr:DUF1572 domain-containing protein [uncultured Psychroserpens sp.]